MSTDLRSLVLVAHLVGAVFMAAPLYMLIVVNERGRFTVPPGYDTDRYMENIIGNHPRRCYFYLAMVLLTGLLLVYAYDAGWGLLVTDWALATKLVALVSLTGLLTYVHLFIQPQINGLFADLQVGDPIPQERRPRLMSLRLSRKRLSGLCLFLMLTAVIMGVRARAEFHPGAVFLLLVFAGLFAWRAFKTPVSYGWF